MSSVLVTYINIYRCKTNFIQLNSYENYLTLKFLSWELFIQIKANCGILYLHMNFSCFLPIASYLLPFPPAVSIFSIFRWVYVNSYILVQLANFKTLLCRYEPCNCVPYICICVCVYMYISMYAYTCMYNISMYMYTCM